MMPYAGLSSRFFYEFYREGISFSVYKEHSCGLLFAIVPGVVFNINEKISVDLNVPVDIYNIEINYERKRDEYRPYHKNTTLKYIEEFKPETINIRFGICYRL